MLAALPILLLVLGANDDALRAQEEIERNLKSLAALPPPVLELKLSPPTQRGFEIVGATFEVDAQPTPKLSAADLARGAKAFDKEVSPGTHSLSATVLVQEKEAALLSDFAVRKVTLEGRVALRTPRGIKLHVAVALRVNVDETEPSKRYRLSFEQTPELLQTTEIPLPPPPLRAAAPVPDAGAPVAVVPPPPPPPVADAGSRRVVKKKKRALQLARAIARTAGASDAPEPADEETVEPAPEPPDAGGPPPPPPPPPAVEAPKPPPPAPRPEPARPTALAIDPGILVGGGGVVLVLVGLVLAIRRR